MIDVYALGTGTCHGLDDRAPPLFYVRWGKDPEEQLVFELSAETRKRVLRATGTDLGLVDRAHIAVSHVHEDHFGGAMSFRVGRHCARGAASLKDSGSVKIYGPWQLKTALQRLEEAHLPERDSQKLELAGLETVHPDHDVEVLIGGAQLQQLRVFHADPLVEAVGFRLTLPNGTVLAYTGDAAWTHDPKSHANLIAENVKRIAKGAHLLICDAAGRIGKPSKRHFHAGEAGTLAREAGVEHLALTHYTGLDSEGDMVKAVRDSGFTNALTALHDGFRLNL